MAEILHQRAGLLVCLVMHPEMRGINHRFIESLNGLDWKGPKSSSSSSPPAGTPFTAPGCMSSNKNTMTRATGQLDAMERKILVKLSGELSTSEILTISEKFPLTGLLSR